MPSNTRDLRFTISGEDKGASKAFDNVGKQADGLGSKLGNIGASLAGGAIGGAVGSFLKGSISAASDFNETLSKTRVVFGQNSKAVEAFAKTAAESIGATKTEALDAASTFGSLFASFGNTAKASQEMSLGLVKLAGDLASFNNASTADALDAIRSGLLGESDPLQRFQINLSAAAIEAEAMSSGLIKMTVDSTKLKTAQLALATAQEAVVKVNKDAKATDLDRAKAANAVKKAEDALKATMGGKKVEMTNAIKAQATYNLIMKQSKAAQGDFARTSSGLANQQRIMAAEFKNAQIALGQKLLPVMTTAMATFSKMIDWTNRHKTATHILIGVVGALTAAVVAVRVATLLHATATTVAAGAMHLFSGAAATEATSATTAAASLAYLTGAETAAGAAGAAAAGGMAAFGVGVATILGPIALVSGALIGLIALMNRSAKNAVETANIINGTRTATTGSGADNGSFVLNGQRVGGGKGSVDVVRSDGSHSRPAPPSANNGARDAATGRNRIARSSSTTIVNIGGKTAAKVVNSENAGRAARGARVVTVP